MDTIAWTLVNVLATISFLSIIPAGVYGWRRERRLFAEQPSSSRSRFWQIVHLPFPAIILFLLTKMAATLVLITALAALLSNIAELPTLVRILLWIPLAAATFAAWAVVGAVASVALRAEVARLRSSSSPKK